MTHTPTRTALITCTLAALTIAALLLLSLLAGPAQEAAAARALAKPKGCGTYKSDSIYPKGKVTAIRGVGCREAKKVAKKFDHTGNAPGKWKCGYGHGGRRLFSCGYGGGGGSLGEMKHALKSDGKGSPG